MDGCCNILQLEEGGIVWEIVVRRSWDWFGSGSLLFATEDSTSLRKIIGAPVFG